jgi:[ribosomal protein S18]-alanine N-acetyltransferase
VTRPSRGALEIRRIRPQDAQRLGDFFEELAASEAATWFHPHALTRESADQLARYEGADLYCIEVEGDLVVGYGMLRGWDAGFDIPSLGIAIGGEYQGRGLGTLLMSFLHAAARARGAAAVRLRVAPENEVAISMYRRLGYQFVGTERGEQVGLVSFRDDSA